MKNDMGSNRADKQRPSTPKALNNQADNPGSVAYQNAVGHGGYCPKHGGWSGLKPTRCPGCLADDKVSDLADEGIEPVQSPANPPTVSINEILEDFLNDYPANTPTKVWKPKRTNAELKSDFVTALYTLIADSLGEDETLQEQSEYDKKHFGHPEADAEENLWLVRQAVRDLFREEQRKILKELFDE